MKNWIAVLAVVVTIDTSTDTLISVPDGTWMAISQCQCFPPSTSTVVCPPCVSTPTVIVPVVSTGPFIMRSWNSPADCYRIQRIWSNGMPEPATWVPCP